MVNSGRPTQAQLEARKARVLAAAEELFVARGFAGTPVAEIARLSRVSPRLITAHFGDKADIFTAIIRRNNDRALTVANEINPGDTLDDILFRAAKFTWITTYSPSSISFLRMSMGEGDRMVAMTSEVAKKSSDHYFGQIEAIFQGLLDRGLIGRGDPRRLAKYFVDLMVSFSLVQAGMGYWDRGPDDAELRDRIAFFCRAVASEAADAEPAAAGV